MATQLTASVIKTDDGKFMLQVQVPASQNVPPKNEITTHDDEESVGVAVATKAKRYL
jgi:hypothetical protein